VFWSIIILELLPHCINCRSLENLPDKLTISCRLKKTDPWKMPKKIQEAELTKNKIKEHSSSQFTITKAKRYSSFYTLSHSKPFNNITKKTSLSLSWSSSSLNLEALNYQALSSQHWGFKQKTLRSITKKLKRNLALGQTMSKNTRIWGINLRKSGHNLK
jgi:hypothetical protein